VWENELSFEHNHLDTLEVHLTADRAVLDRANALFDDREGPLQV
jgi:hypothetical protein